MKSSTDQPNNDKKTPESFVCIDETVDLSEKDFDELVEILKNSYIQPGKRWWTCGPNGTGTTPEELRIDPFAPTKKTNE